MWDRKELKAKGKAAFKANYLRSVIAALVLTLFVMASGPTIIGNSVGSTVGNGLESAQAEQVTGEEAQEIQNLLTELDSLSQEEKEEVLLFLGSLVIGAVLVMALIHALLDVFVLNPLEVGCQRFFLVNCGESAKLSELFYGFKKRYGRTILTLFLRDLYLVLWGLLFVIPGIVKAYSYRLVPYILADNPDIGARDAITLSRQMMDGQKWAAFVLDLSFLGWNILTILTMGLVGVFYANPYEIATSAELYKVISENYNKVAV